MAYQAELTFFHLKNTETFFHTINQCLCPVTIQLPNGKTEDLRCHDTLQGMLSYLAPIDTLKICSHNSKDTQHLLKLMFQS